MTFMTAEGERLISRLVRLAGGPTLVEESLRELDAEKSSSVTVEDLVRRILEKRSEQVQAAAQRMGSQTGPLAGR